MIYSTKLIFSIILINVWLIDLNIRIYDGHRISESTFLFAVVVNFILYATWIHLKFSNGSDQSSQFSQKICYCLFWRMNRTEPNTYDMKTIFFSLLIRFIKINLNENKRCPESHKTFSFWRKNSFSFCALANIGLFKLPVHSSVVVAIFSSSIHLSTIEKLNCKHTIC